MLFIPCNVIKISNIYAIFTSNGIAISLNIYAIYISNVITKSVIRDLILEMM